MSEGKHLSAEIVDEPDYQFIYVDLEFEEDIRQATFPKSGEGLRQAELLETVVNSYATHQQELSAARGMVKDLMETLEMAQVQTGRTMQILMDGSEEIECLLIPSFEVREAIAKASEFLKADVKDKKK